MAVYKSTDAGATWPTEMLIGATSTSSRTACHRVAVAHSDPLVIYACGEEADLARIYSSIDGGASWTDITGDLAAMHETYDTVYACWVAPDDENFIVVGSSDGVFATANGGASWSATTVTTRTYDIVYHPAGDRLYAGTYGGGVFRSDDRGSTWVQTNSGLDVALVYDLDINIREGWLYAGTYGGGVYRLDLDPSPLWVGADEIPKDSGRTIELVLNGGAAHAGRNYLMAGSLSGTDPGTLLPGGQATIPLNRDWFTDYILARLNTNVFTRFWGTLDAEGAATAELRAPPIPAWGGRVLYFAYCTAAPYDFASNPIEVYVTP